jgi:glycosyltransferase involved in cell wall biosynthesis
MASQETNSRVVSVVVPVYNGEKTIERAIRSALDQKIEGCEILVVNDGSTDGTATKIEAFRTHPQIRVLQHPGGANCSVTASRLLALREARGEFIAFLDADDEYLPGKLTRHIEILQQNQQVVLVHGRVQRLSDDPAMGEWTLDLGEEPEIYDLSKKKYFLRRNYICNSTVVCRRSALRPDEDSPPVMIGGGEDWVIWNCVSFRGRFYYDPMPLTIYAFHSGSFTHRLLRRPGAVELTAIEFYLCMLPRLPRLGMRLRALIALLYNLTALMELRRGPALKRGLGARVLNGFFSLLKKKKPE